MSTAQENLTKFYEAVVQDPNLQQQIFTTPDQASLVSTALKLGKEKGYDFTEQEVEDWLTVSTHQSSSDELSDEDLELIAGGKSAKEALSGMVQTVYGLPRGAVGEIGQAIAEHGVCKIIDHPNFAQHSTNTTAAAVSCNH